MSGVELPAPYRCRHCRRMMTADTLTLSATLVQPPDLHAIGVLRSGREVAHFIPQRARFEVWFADGLVRSFVPLRELDGRALSGRAFGAYCSHWIDGSTLCLECRDRRACAAVRVVHAADDEEQERRRRAEEVAAEAARAEERARELAAAQVAAAREAELQRLRAGHQNHGASRGGFVVEDELVAERRVLEDRRREAVDARNSLARQANVDRDAVQEVVEPQLTWVLAGWHVAATVIALTARSWIAVGAVTAIVLSIAGLAMVVTEQAVTRHLASSTFWRPRNDLPRRRARVAACLTAVGALLAAAARQQPVPALVVVELVAMAAVVAGAAFDYQRVLRQHWARHERRSQEIARLDALIDINRADLARFRCGQPGCPSCVRLGY